MDDLRAVTDAAGCGRAAVLGISEGGPMSALFAASYPDRVSSLVLYGTWARMLKAADHPEGIDPRLLDRLLDRHPPEPRPLPLRVRAGMAVNIGALASPDEVYVSSTVKAVA
jgi:pimeloyl-ACP methyl ester carboxylesterase